MIKILSKKGFTMVELMVSISIIAIVMIFLVKLLVDAKYDVTNELYNTSDQINRAEIIKTIENDLNNKSITRIQKDTSADMSKYKLALDIVTDNGTGKIKICKVDNDSCKVDDLEYKTTGGSTRKWTLKGKTNGAKYDVAKAEYQVLKNNLNEYAITINIPVIIDENKKDSQMDNIILTFYGEGQIPGTSYNAAAGNYYQQLN